VLFREAVDLASRHITDGIVFPKDYLNAGPTAEALWGNCPRPSSRQPPVVTALCNPAAGEAVPCRTGCRRETAIQGPPAVVRSMALLADGHPEHAAKILSVTLSVRPPTGTGIPAAQFCWRAQTRRSAIRPAQEKHTRSSSLSGRTADPDIPILQRARRDYARLK